MRFNTLSILWMLTVMSKSLQGQITYLALGDSYTIGESVAPDSNYPMQLSGQINSLINPPLDTTIIVATTGWRTDELIAAIEEAKFQDEFDIVTLLIGVNNQYQGRDIDQYKAELKLLTETAIDLCRNGNKGVIMLSIPDYGFTPFGQTKKPSKIARELDAYNAFAKKLSDKMAIEYIYITDYSRLGLARPWLVASDGLHPSAKQYALWVERILSESQVIKSLVDEHAKNN